MKCDSIKEFNKYIKNQITPAVDDIAGLDDKSRKHVLKLVYTNLVDRFDVMVDNVFLDNCRSEYVLDHIDSHMSDSISEAQLLKLLMYSGNIQDAIDERLKDVIRTTMLRKRHSIKLNTLFKAFGCDDYTRNNPIVSPGSGKIVLNPKKHKVNVPQSVCGYADWLYSRRNGIVHGTGSSKFLMNDIQQLKKIYSYNAPATFRLSLGAISFAITFYLAITKRLAEVK